MKRTILIAAGTLSIIFSGYAQDGYNPLSVRPVHTSDVMYQKTVTRALDLREKQNEPLFSRNNEITALIINGVIDGQIKAYTNDSLNTQVSVSDFYKKMQSPALASLPTDTVDLFLEYGENWRDVKKMFESEKYMARDLYQMEIKENVLFDKQQSKWVYDIQTITIYIPADHLLNTRGIQTVVASFSYKELAENLFKDNPKAIWYNVENDHENKNLADAFDLRLFSAYIIKVSNPQDLYLSDMYSDEQKGRMASNWSAEKLMEYEHNLWEF
ncbi:gliding motility protein GldN [Cytophaga aurantiaca]|uniref:type IX secretion system ring protein PorN/GldN n=1 Tax=Cytophaga aurantiaca TaxID=29530 RepID=UPI00037C060D|nr:gliding motility protein GldN [Cytophaga aurantiaca]